ncbi:Kunitz trypsin inhibitor [Quillaja saponaria]|uniref:Kunitz trypsin inhibitor n=1 Tax=Quillaja saponaria TaxID=32244 RepID=A0AAD7M533_QUISA|nr:Kunitz trypsin inhibitor [Quillaja saponaria]
MKSIALLAVSFLLFAFNAFAIPDPVFDISGDIVQGGVSYDILPVHKGRGGGFTLANTGNKQSGPLDVIQQHVGAFDSLPLTFPPLIQRRGEVHISNDLIIKVSAKTSSELSTVWKLAKQPNGIWFVTTGGVEGNPGFDTITNWFKIEKYGNDYKLAFCPEVADAPIFGKILVFMLMRKEKGIWLWVTKFQHLLSCSKGLRLPQNIWKLWCRRQWVRGQKAGLPNKPA